jgi:hypothetical protein
VAFVTPYELGRAVNDESTNPPNQLSAYGSAVLWAAVPVLVLVSCALLVYLGAHLLARLVLWVAYYPPEAAFRECVKGEFSEHRGYKVHPHSPAPVAIESLSDLFGPQKPLRGGYIPSENSLRAVAPCATLVVPENFHAP